jgi:hypothetical protein
MIDDLTVFVFSKNRGQYLLNCLESIKSSICLENIIIFDDFSDNKDTIKIIDDLKKKYNFVYRDDTYSSLSLNLYGGLTLNMQKAMEIVKTDYCIFVQDDTQFVRNISKYDILNFKKIFDYYNDIVELRITFQFHYAKEEFEKVKIHKDLKCYYDVPIWNYNFCDIGLFNVKRFKEKIKYFKNNEIENSLLFKEKNIKIADYAYPFVMWLPFAKPSRNPIDELVELDELRILLEDIIECDFYPYKFFTEEKNKLFLERDLNIRPFAEDFLDPIKKLPKNNCWFFSAGIENLICQGGKKEQLAILLLNLDNKIKNRKEFCKIAKEIILNFSGQNEREHHLNYD